MPSPMTHGDTSWLSAPLSSRDGKSGDTRRHLMVICTFAIQRQASPMARRDKIGHLLPLSKTLVSFEWDYFSLICHPKTSESDGMQGQIMVFSLSLFSKLLQLPLPFEDTQVHGHTGTNNVFSHCMPSKATMTIICISKTTMSLVIACLQRQQ